MNPNPKPTKAPLRRIVRYSDNDRVVKGKAEYILDCGHAIRSTPQAGLMASWRRVRCKECVK